MGSIFSSGVFWKDDMIWTQKSFLTWNNMYTVLMYWSRSACLVRACASSTLLYAAQHITHVSYLETNCYLFGVSHSRAFHQLVYHVRSAHVQGFPGGSVVKNPPAKQETWVLSLVEKVPWRKEWQPTPVFLPGGSHGQRSLEGCSLWSWKESDTT